MNKDNEIPLGNILRTIESLPLVSNNMKELFEMATMKIDDVDTGTLIALINQSPSIAAKIIGLANSAFFARGAYSSLVKDAVMRVGLTSTKNIILSIVASSSFDHSKCLNFNAQTYWERALYVATLNKRMCIYSDKNNLSSDSAYLAGLLFNFGDLILAHVAPDSYGECIETGKDLDLLSQFKNEEKILGVDSTMAGSIVALNWTLPLFVPRVITHYATPSYRNEDWEYSLLTHLSINAQRNIEHDGYKADPAILYDLELTEEAFNEAVKRSIADYDQTKSLARLFSN